MKLVEIVRQASKQPLTTADGEPAPLELEPPLSSDDLQALEARLPCGIPADVRELLDHCSGFTGGAVQLVDFTGRQCDFDLEAVFPHGLPVAADGCGNFWVVDLLPTTTTWGPIYFACHDPPVILYQSATLGEFLAELFKWSTPPHESLVGEVHDDRLFEVWRRNPGVLGYAECAASEDADLRSFAQRLGPKFQIVDLRDVPVGFGFSWGRYGPNTVVERHGELSVFAYEKRRGILSRLLGRA